MISHRHLAIRWLHVLAFVFVCALWGLNFVGAKVSVRYADPLFLATVRMLLTGSVLLAVARARGASASLSRRQLPALLLFAMFNYFGLQTLMYDSQTHVSAGLAGVILYTYPVITAVGARFYLGEQFTTVKILGICSGFGGVALVAGLGTGSVLGELEMSGAAVCWAAGTLVFKKRLSANDVYAVSGWAFLIAGAMAAAALFGTGSFTVHSTTSLWLWLGYSVLGGSVVTNAIWLQLLRHEDAAVASAQLFMTPLFGLLFGWLVLSEHTGTTLLGGAVLVAAGVILVNQTARVARAQQGGAPLARSAIARGVAVPGGEPVLEARRPDEHARHRVPSLRRPGSPAGGPTGLGLGRHWPGEVRPGRGRSG